MHDENHYQWVYLGKHLILLLGQHMKKKTQTLFLHWENLGLEQSETWSRGKSCCSCLFTCLLEHHPAVLGTWSVAQIKTNGFSMATERTEHIPCAGCAAWLAPTPQTLQEASFAASPGTWPLWPPTRTPPSSLTASQSHSQLDTPNWAGFPCKGQQQQLGTNCRETRCVNTAFSWPWTWAVLSLVLLCSRTLQWQGLNYPG